MKEDLGVFVIQQRQRQKSQDGVGKQPFAPNEGKQRKNKTRIGALNEKKSK